MVRLSDSARIVLAAAKKSGKPSSISRLAKIAEISEARANHGAVALCEAGLASLRGIMLTLTDAGKAWRPEPRPDPPIEETPGLRVGRMVALFMGWEPTPERLIGA